MPAKKKSTFTEGPLNILYSSRLRLTEEQRDKLKAAHRAFRLKYAAAPEPSVMPGSSISVETQTVPPQQAYAAFGLSDLVVADLIVSRESISINTILQLQKLLGVEVITRKEMEAKFSNYLDYIWQ